MNNGVLRIEATGAIAERLLAVLGQYPDLLSQVRQPSDAAPQPTPGIAAPISSTLDAWIASRARLCRDPKSERQNRRWVAACYAHAGLVDAAALRTRDVEQYLAALAGSGKSSSFQNNHLAAISQFCEWAKRQGIMPSVPTVGVLRAEGTDRGEGNAAFSPSEAAAVLAAARLSEATNRRANTPKRSDVYVIAWATGLRRKEIAALRRRNVVGLGTPDARLELSRAGTKNRKGATLPLHDAAARVFEQLCTGLEPDALIFDGRDGRPVVPHHRIVARDIIAAGWVRRTRPGVDGPIPLDENGNVYGMHSFRKGFCTALAESGAPEMLATKLMRHSDSRLTNRVYNKARRAPLRDALQAVPGLDPASADAPPVTPTR